MSRRLLSVLFVVVVVVACSPGAGMARAPHGRRDLARRPSGAVPESLHSPARAPGTLVSRGRDRRSDRRGTEEDGRQGHDGRRRTGGRGGDRERAGAGRHGPIRHGRPARDRSDRPALREQGQGDRPAGPRGRRDARLRPRRPHDLPGRHGDLARRAQERVVRDRRPDRPARRGDHRRGPEDARRRPL